MKILGEITYPELLALDIDIDRALNETGDDVAGRAVRALRSGRVYQGAGLPGDITLKRTGKLLNSIRWTPRLKEVGPTGRRSDVSKTARSNYGLLRILASGRDKRKRFVRPEFNPLGGSRIGNEATELFARAVDRQLTRGRDGIKVLRSRTIKV